MKARPPTQPAQATHPQARNKTYYFQHINHPAPQRRDPTTGTRWPRILLTLTFRIGGWAMMPPEERLSLKSAPPEVSVALPTGQDRGGPSEEVEVCVQQQERGQNQSVCPPLTSRGTGSALQLTRKTLTPKPCFLQLVSSQICPGCPTPATPCHTNLEISQRQHPSIK